MLRYPFAEAASDLVEGSYGGQDARVVYAVFTTPSNSIAGNAVCAFRIRDLLDTFEGAFKEQVNIVTSEYLEHEKLNIPINHKDMNCVHYTINTTTNLSSGDCQLELAAGAQDQGAGPPTRALRGGLQSAPGDHAQLRARTQHHGRGRAFLLWGQAALRQGEFAVSLACSTT